MQGELRMLQPTDRSQRREPQASPEGSSPGPEPVPVALENVRQWAMVSALRERSSMGQRVIVVTEWAVASDRPSRSSENAEPAEDESALVGEPERALLPPLELLRTVATRWLRLAGEDAAERPTLLALRAAGALSPQEVAAWCPGAAVRLYTLAGPVEPLPDGALEREPLARYSVVRAPNMSFWPHLRELIEEQERAQPGMELWEDQGHDLAALEEELAWWLASPHGLVINLYEGEQMVGHLSLARQRDETEGCDGWGILALHIAQQARGQRLGTLLQRIAATLIATRRAERQRASAREAEGVPERSLAGEAGPSQADATVPAAEQKTPPASVLAQAELAPADEASNWPTLFGFVPAHNIAALRGAYEAGREIIGTYVDVPVAALVEEG